MYEEFYLKYNDKLEGCPILLTLIMKEEKRHFRSKPVSHSQLIGLPYTGATGNIAQEGQGLKQHGLASQHETAEPQNQLYQRYGRILQNTSLSNSTASIAEGGTSIGNTASTAVFIIVFALMILLMKRHFSKFISFYILRRDYLRMRCVERSDDEGGVNRANLRPLSSDNQSISQNLLGGNRSGATRYETLSEFRRVLASNMRIYHHMIGLCPPKVLTFLKNTLKLPCQIVCTLIIAGLIINLSLSLAFSQAFCKEEGDSQETCLSGHIITVTLIDAILSMVAIVFLTQIISGNYLHFLKDNRTPQSGPRLRPESSAGDAINQRLVEDPPGSAVTPGQFDQQPKLLVSKGMKMRNRKVGKRKVVIAQEESTEDIVTQEGSDQLPPLTLNQQQLYLHSIKEDDEEQPLSPQKQNSMDDIGDDELSPGKPNTATDGGILPPLGLIRSLKNNEYETSFMKLHITDGAQGPDFLDNGFPDIASSLHGDPNGSRELSEIQEENSERDYQRTKSHSNSEITQRDEGNNEDQGGEVEQVGAINISDEDNKDQEATRKPGTANFSRKSGSTSNNSARFDPGSELLTKDGQKYPSEYS